MSVRATMLCTAANLENSRLVVGPVVKPIKVGVVGCGRRTCYNVVYKTLIYDEYELCALCDIRPERAQAALKIAQDEFKASPRVYTDYRDMFKNEELDAVILMLDPDKQIPIACDAMNAGLHVMAEVPLTYSLDECWQLVVTAERTQKIFMLMEQLRYSGYIRAWRTMIDEGVLGKPLYVEGQYFHYLPGMHYMDDKGLFYPPQQVKDLPKQWRTWRDIQPSIGYLPHELSPLLYAINDRVVKVVGMSTRKQGYLHPEYEYADMQAALMHTEKDVILRMAVNFGTPSDSHCAHWHHIKGSLGAVESPRTAKDTFKFFRCGWQIADPIDMPWSSKRVDAPPAAVNSGHGDLDYYVFAYFADAVLHHIPVDIDVYQAVETAAPAILAAHSIEHNNKPIDVPNFRPGPHRQAGQMPQIV